MNERIFTKKFKMTIIADFNNINCELKFNNNNIDKYYNNNRNFNFNKIYF